MSVTPLRTSVYETHEDGEPVLVYATYSGMHLPCCANVTQCRHYNRHEKFDNGNGAAHLIADGFKKLIKLDEEYAATMRRLDENDPRIEKALSRYHHYDYAHYSESPQYGANINKELLIRKSGAQKFRLGAP